MNRFLIETEDGLFLLRASNGADARRRVEKAGKSLLNLTIVTKTSWNASLAGGGKEFA